MLVTRKALPRSASSFLRSILTTLTILTVSTSLTASALKHSFSVDDDRRFFIGPIGTPYGFLKNGVYNLQVSDFRIESNLQSSDSKPQSKLSKFLSHDKAASKSSADMLEGIQGLHPGFLLRRFQTENEFNQFMDDILENRDTCGFEELMGELDERFEVDSAFFNSQHNHNPESKKSDSNSSPHDDASDGNGNDDGDGPDKNDDDDETVARGPGVVDGGSSGIFLSMNHAKMWTPNQPEIHHTFTVEEAGYYFLFYQICLDQSAANNDFKKHLFVEMKSSFHLDYEYLNFDVMGKKSYLTAGEMPLPHLYLYFSVSYAILLLLWVRSFSGDGTSFGGGGNNSGKKVTVFAIHHLMSAVLGLKTLSIFFESVRYHYIRVNGHAELWSFIYYGLTFVKGTFLFTVILLLGSGWSFFKPFLTPKERRVIYFVFILQIIDNIAVVVLTHETLGEQLYSDWSAILHLVDIISCCAILIPIVWQVNSLEQSLEQQDAANAADGDGNKNGNAAPNGEVVLDSESTRLHEKLSLFRFFYLAVVAYIYFTRIVVYLIASSLSYNHTWWRYLIGEVGTLLFYVSIGMKFKPKVENEYSTVLQTEDFESGLSSSTATTASKPGNIELGSISAAKQAKSASSKLKD